MKHLNRFVAVGAFALAATFYGHALAVNDEPLTGNWAPSEWGADDKGGTVNWTTPEMVLKAVKLVKQGKVATLGKVYQQDAPAFDDRGWRMTIPGLPTGGPFGSQGLVYNDEYLAERKIILWGADNWGSEAAGPGFGGENDQPFECHVQMMTRRGIWNLENLDFSQLLADNVGEFLFVWSPLKMKGATGSPGNPVALY